jgi:hypothetical protein
MSSKWITCGFTSIPIHETPGVQTRTSRFVIRPETLSIGFERTEFTNLLFEYYGNALCLRLVIALQMIHILFSHRRGFVAQFRNPRNVLTNAFAFDRRHYLYYKQR